MSKTLYERMVENKFFDFVPLRAEFFKLLDSNPNTQEINNILTNQELLDLIMAKYDKNHFQTLLEFALKYKKEQVIFAPTMIVLHQNELLDLLTIPEHQDYFNETIVQLNQEQFELRFTVKDTNIFKTIQHFNKFYSLLNQENQNKFYNSLSRMRIKTYKADDVLIEDVKKIAEEIDNNGNKLPQDKFLELTVFEIFMQKLDDKLSKEMVQSYFNTHINQLSPEDRKKFFDQATYNIIYIESNTSHSAKILLESFKEETLAAYRRVCEMFGHNHLVTSERYLEEKGLNDFINILKEPKTQAQIKARVDFFSGKKLKFVNVLEAQEQKKEFTASTKSFVNKPDFIDSIIESFVNNMLDTAKGNNNYPKDTEFPIFKMKVIKQLQSINMYGIIEQERDNFLTNIQDQKIIDSFASQLKKDEFFKRLTYNEQTVVRFAATIWYYLAKKIAPHSIEKNRKLG